MHNATFWRGQFKRAFVPHLERLLETVEQRLLPAFDGLSAEADQIQRDTYDELGRLPADPDLDPSVPAELAFEAGCDHYMGMQAVKQAMLNMFAPLLYHAWEQQLLTFHRREVLHPGEEHDNAQLSVGVLRQRLAAKGLDITGFLTYPTLEELRLVANTVKHADGGSADQLKALRPDLFEAHLDDIDLDLPRLPYIRRVYAPLSGEDLYLTIEDLRGYGQATIAFWDELAEALARL